MPLSTNWLKSSYFVQVILTPVDSKLLPWSYLTDLTDEERLSPQTWVDTNFTPLSHLIMYGKRVSINGESYVDEILVKVGRQISQLNLAEETNTIRTAMQKNWTIKLNEVVFSFEAKFYRYASFIEDGSPRYDLMSSISSDSKVYEERPPPKVYDYLSINFRSTTASPIVLQKTHFCERVRLHKIEWLGGFQEVRLNITPEHPGVASIDRSVFSDVSIDEPLSNEESVFNNKSTSSTGLVSEGGAVLGDSEFDIYVDNMGAAIIEICVEAFNPNYGAQELEINDAVSDTKRSGRMIYFLLKMVLIVRIGPIDL